MDIFLITYFLGCGLRIRNPFLAVGIGKPFFFCIVKNIRKFKNSCSITDLTEPKKTLPNLTKFNQSW